VNALTVELILVDAPHRPSRLHLQLQSDLSGIGRCFESDVALDQADAIGGVFACGRLAGNV
jgi:hypothetical protein